MRDRYLLYSTAFFRSVGVALTSALLAIYLDKKGLSPTAIGAVVAVGLAGGAVGTGLVSFFADRWGRRRALVILAAFGSTGGLGLALAPGLGMLLAAAFCGMINTMGHDRAGAYTLEQSALSGTETVEERTHTITVYHAVGDAGAVAGSLAAALAPLVGYQTLWLGYAVTAGTGLLLYPWLSQAVEVASPRQHISAQSRRRIARFAGLSAIDSLGSGFLTSALVSFYFYKRFGLVEGQIAVLFLAADACNILSNFGAEWLARWIGLVNTMVFTHIPANLLLIALPFCPAFRMAASVFLLRELLIEMDVPSRQSYLASIVDPEERTAALGIVQLTRTSMWAAAPAFAGWLMRVVTLASPLYIGSSIKIAYDLLLWRAFRRLKPR